MFQFQFFHVTVTILTFLTLFLVNSCNSFLVIKVHSTNPRGLLKSMTLACETKYQGLLDENANQLNERKYHVWFERECDCKTIAEKPVQLKLFQISLLIICCLIPCPRKPKPHLLGGHLALHLYREHLISSVSYTSVY